MNRPGAPKTAYDAPLGGGLVVEASAGTGKTYTLTTLVARLVVEAAHRIDDLLIVTFTVAATGELRTRVWETLRAACDALAGLPATTQAAELAGHWRRSGIADADATARLTRAIRDFDRASITTIHGFCQRALGEFALDAGLPFRFGVSGDGALEVESAARDFWRREMAAEPVSLLEYAREHGFLPDQGAQWAGRVLAMSDAVRPAMSADEFAHAWTHRQEAWRKAFDTLHAAWTRPERRREFLEFRESAAYRWRKKSGNSVKDEASFDAVTGALDANDPHRLGLAAASYFGRERLTAQLHKATPPPDTPLFDRFDGLAAATRELREFWLAGRRRRLLADAAATLHDGVWRNRQLTFDALLTELHDALTGDNGGALAERMRRRYPVALIDEFQDTDRLQAQIFEAVYPNDGLIVVGDPKQSIFRFRGADVFAYVDARARLGDSRARLPLTRNYRSTPALVEAVNAVFQRENALVLPEIDFEPAMAAGTASTLRVENDDFDPKPFQMHVFDAPEGSKKWTKGELIEVAAAHTADRIAALLVPGTAVIEEGASSRPLAADDVAVLVRTGKQGRTMIRELRARGIRTVEIGTDSVFDSLEAKNLHRLLHALGTDEAEFDAAARLRGALAADIFGLDMTDLDRLHDDDGVWATWLERAREWRRIWASSGISSLMRHLLFADDPACAGNLLAYPDGPRRLTNFLHLTDLLHDAETRNRLSRRGLLDWFAHFKARSERGGETAQLRLESDEELVRIVTIHRAKGLEYPVVFCPFAWWGRPPDRNPTAQYYDVGAGEPVLHLQPSEEDSAREEHEEFADEVRLFYVALTRAKYRCEVTWAPATHSDHAPLAWLLDDVDVNQLRERAPKAISVKDAALPGEAVTLRQTDADEETLGARELRRYLGGTRQLTSYSALTAREQIPSAETVDEPDHDADEPDAETPAEPALDAFAFPAGSRTGNCLHEVLERYAEGGDLEAVCREALARHGIDAKWLPVARSMARNVWRAPLGTVEPTFRLADIDRPVAEMEFHLPVRHFRRDRLAGILAEHGYEGRVPEDDREINGFLHGFIDMVAQHEGRWYVLDYKSNWLGASLAAYDPASIEASMRQHGYHLQYLLYLTALHRLLKVRLPDYDFDRHIGGACYLFLRAMHPDAPGRGVHFDRPPRACIEAIDDCLSGGDDG